MSAIRLQSRDLIAKPRGIAIDAQPGTGFPSGDMAIEDRQVHKLVAAHVMDEGFTGLPEHCGQAFRHAIQELVGFFPVHARSFRYGWMGDGLDGWM